MPSILHIPWHSLPVTVKTMNPYTKESEAQFRHLVEKANIGILIDDPEGNFTYLNQKYAEIFGYSREELTKRNIRSVVHPHDVERVMRYHRERLRGKVVPSQYECMGIKKDGSVIHLEVVASPFRNNGNIVGTHSYVWDITRHKKLQNGHEAVHVQLRVALRGFILALAKSIEERDPFTSDHQQRAADLARAIAVELGLSKRKTDGILMAGIVHDIGKIKVPAEILNKTMNLSMTELEIVKTHPKVGYDILKNIAFPWPIAQIVYQHHERLDGSGYPQGLTGDQIRPEARILAVADVVEAIASHRPYRAAYGIEVALEEISRHKGRRFDSETVDACLRLFRKKYQF